MGCRIEESLERIQYLIGESNFRKNYQCHTKIRQGGFGTVFKGTDLTCGHDVVVKFVEIKRVPEVYYWKKNDIAIPLEAVLLSLCSNVPGVVKLQSLCQLKQGWFFVMLAIPESIDLFDHISNKKHLSENEASNILYQLIDILRSCRKCGVLHRDIKDENIILDRNTGLIYLIDFGSGALFESCDDEFDKYEGTRVYSPPEWIEHKRYNGCKLESWSIGVLLFNMVCGDIPFVDDKQIVACQLKYKSCCLSGTCKDLIEKCLLKDANCRIDLDEMTRHAWLIDHGAHSRHIHKSFLSLNKPQNIDLNSGSCSPCRTLSSLECSGDQSQRISTTSDDCDKGYYSQNTTIPVHNTTTSFKKEAAPQLNSRKAMFYISDDEIDDDNDDDVQLCRCSDEFISPSMMKISTSKKFNSISCQM